MESSLQEKMTSPQPTSIIAVKQEPEDEVKEEKVDLGKCLVSLLSKMYCFMTVQIYWYKSNHKVLPPEKISLFK